MKHIQTFESVNEIRTSMISGTSGRTIDSLEDRKYELKKDVKGAMIGDFTNVTLPKGTIIYNLPGGVFADHFSLKDRYTTKSSQGPQWFDKPTFKGVSIRRMPDTLAAIEKNSKVLEAVNEAAADITSDQLDKFLKSKFKNKGDKETYDIVVTSQDSRNDDEEDDYATDVAIGYDVHTKAGHVRAEDDIFFDLDQQKWFDNWLNGGDMKSLPNIEKIIKNHIK